MRFTRLLVPWMVLACSSSTPGSQNGAAGAGGTGVGGNGVGNQGGSSQTGGSAGGPAGGTESAGSAGESGGSAGTSGVPAFPPLTPDELAIAGDLHGAFLQVDCASEEIELQYCLPADMGIQEIPLVFGGEFAIRYAVTLRVWGVMEAVTYENGMLDGNHFYIGGEGVTPMTAEYGLQVGNQTYYLNHEIVGVAGDHYTYGFTYVTSPIVLLGGVNVTLFVRDPDNFMNTNHMQSTVQDPTSGLQEKLDVILAQPLQGQFVYIEVGSVEAVP